MHQVVRSTFGLVILICQLCLIACVPDFNSALDISGTVLDQDGEGLEDVQLRIRQSKFTLLTESFSSSEESEMILSDGEFRIRCRTCSSMRVHFTKDGYYSESRDYSGESRPPDPGSRVGSGKQNLLLRGEEIILRSDANEARLVRYEGRLNSSASGILTIAPLRRDLGSNGVSLDLLDQPPSREASFLPGYVQLIPALDETGELASQPFPAAPSLLIPASPQLDFSQADGGIVLSQLDGVNPQEVYRAMRTAPAEGYQSSIALDTTERGRYYYFYCRIGDYFGKGYVLTPDFKTYNNEQRVTTYVELRLNLDGSRNVETRL